VIVAVLDLGDVANGLASADVAVACPLVVARLAQEQHRFFGVAEPLVGVETLFRREPAGVLEMSEARVVGGEREAKSMFQRNPGLESLEDARTSLYSFRL